MGEAAESTCRAAVGCRRGGTWASPRSSCTLFFLESCTRRSEKKRRALHFVILTSSGARVDSSEQHRHGHGRRHEPATHLGFYPPTAVARETVFVHSGPSNLINPSWCQQRWLAGSSSKVGPPGQAQAGRVLAQATTRERDTDPRGQAEGIALLPGSTGPNKRPPDTPMPPAARNTACWRGLRALWR